MTVEEQLAGAPLPTEPGHLMTRAHYEQLARQAAQESEQSTHKEKP